MGTNPATNPGSFEDYYWGLSSNPRLLARSSSQPWTLPRTGEIGHDGNFERLRKSISVVGCRHPLRTELDQGLRQNIRQVLESIQPCRWISVDYVRIGYDHDTEASNPVVAWVTVEEDCVPLVEAQRVVDALAQECRRAGLPDVEVEMTEGRRTANKDLLSLAELPMPVRYPHIGSSIARKDSEAIGTLGGYVQIDGEIMGITNHHVAIGSRLEAFPTAEEESSKVTYDILQPAKRDLDKLISSCKRSLEEGTLKPTSTSEAETKELQIQLDELESWTSERCLLGNVWKTSGLRPRAADKPHCFRLDWALIKLGNASRLPDHKNLVNQVPTFKYLNADEADIAFKAAGQDKMRVDLPEYLKRGLSLEETLNLQDSAEDIGKKYIVWKFGRTTHYTFGAISGILADYRSDDGLITDELMVLDIKVFRWTTFSDRGDSGSFVWDSDGYVSGMLWGGKEGSSQHYITPIQYLLEDIRQVCNAKEVKLLVGQEDETDAMPGPLE